MLYIHEKNCTFSYSDRDPSNTNVRSTTGHASLIRIFKQVGSRCSSPSATSKNRCTVASQLARNVASLTDNELRLNCSTCAMLYVSSRSAVRSICSKICRRWQADEMATRLENFAD